MIEEPALNYDMKFNPGGDDPYTFAGAQQAMHLSDRNWQYWQYLLTENAYDQSDWCSDRGIRNVDGKTDAIVVDGFPAFTDFFCTIDENRLMLPYQDSERRLLLPTNKEIQRAKFRAYGVYSAIAKAKAQYGEKWRDHLLEYTTMDVLTTATNESVELMGLALAEVANRILDADIFETQPIESWAGEFLPYASLDMS